MQAAAQAIGQQLLVLDVRSDRDIETAFATFVQRGAGALLGGAGAFMYSHRERVAALAARHALPAIYDVREHVAAGGLMSYAPSITDAYRQLCRTHPQGRGSGQAAAACLTWRILQDVALDVAPAPYCPKIAWCGMTLSL